MVSLDTTFDHIINKTNRFSVFCKPWDGNRKDSFFHEIKPLLIGILNNRYSSFKDVLKNYNQVVIQNIETLNSESITSSSPTYKLLIKQLFID